jgi:hypothetical protein
MRKTLDMPLQTVAVANYAFDATLAAAAAAAV